MKVFILLSVFAVAFAQECGDNQHYESCGTACPLTCKNYNDPPKACILLCNPGCHCDEGYVKTDDGHCVRPEKCSAPQEVCGENERYNECGTACPLTCDNYANPPKVCVLMCKIGCECEKGYVRNSEGRCVRPEQCPARTSSTCDLPAERGLCMAYMPRYHFDRTSGECKRFIYGGCGGNENNFKTLEECKQACGTQSAVGVCSLRAEVGKCRGYFPRYYYDEETQKCQKFIYGGCGGNENNFQTLDECHRTCGAQASVGVCSLEAEPGVCRAYIPRYFYNEKTGKCERFIYGGCGGNGNNFATLEDCHNTCA